ncbi:hypothetical protein LOC67_05310 [Stieleria sp. JC731]|uniref:hypothetical protein n=1 Tax=Pirellulaceae TaxID=2691357 RepID=UPI001E5BDA4C|nr:hypothetical protein [Stieleria sp. JC731]MCC9599971.1 hypothetical protein [Stieleria sp. JC731]
MWFRRLAPAFLLTTMWAPLSFAQTATELPTRPDELVRQLSSHASTGGHEQAVAVGRLIQVGAWNEAVRWLEEIGKSDETDALADAARTIGPTMMLRVSLREEMTDAARDALTKMSAALKETNQSAQTLQAAIADLNSDSVDKVVAANRVLLQGGQAAISEMTKAIGHGLSQSHFNKVIEVLRTFGQDAVDAVGELALYGTANVRSNALIAFLSLADQERALLSSLGAQFGTNSTEAERQIARRFTGVSSKTDAIQYMTDRLAILREDAQRCVNNQNPVLIWSIADKATSVAATRSTELYRCYRQAFDLAQQIRRFDQLPPAIMREALATDLTYRVMADLDWGTPEQLQQVSSSYGEAVSTSSLTTGLRESMSRGDEAAALGFIRLLAVDADPETLNSYGGKRSALVDAAIEGTTPRIRYEAAELIATLIQNEGHAHFSGSSEVNQTFSEMASLNDRSSAVLIETRPNVAVQQEAILGQLGHDVRLVTSAMQAEHEVAKGGDLRMIVSKIQLADAAAVELVDRIRRLPRGRNIPIVFFSDQSVHPDAVESAKLETRSSRWSGDQTPSVYVLPIPGGTAAFSDVLTEVQEKQRLEPLSVSDRARFQKIAQTALQSVSNRP